MNPDDFPLDVFEVDCDGSACGSGPDGRHIHPPQNGHAAWGRVVVRNHERVRYEDAQGITRLSYPASRTNGGQ